MAGGCQGCRTGRTERQAVGPLLKHYGNFPDTRFVPIPYPTTICEAPGAVA